jgi:hypothetical protein
VSLRRADLVQLGAAVVFAISLFLGWYGTDARNPHSNVGGHRGSISAWVAHPVLRYLFVAAVIAAFTSAWQTLRAQHTSGHRGEMSSVVGVIVAALVFIQGWIARPGDPSATISLKPGWFVAMAASLVVVGAANARLPEAARRRTPPGSVA